MTVFIMTVVWTSATVVCTYITFASPRLKWTVFLTNHTLLLSSASAVRELLDVRIAVLDYHTQFALMRIGLGPKTEGRKTSPSSMQTNQEEQKTTEELTNNVVADAIAKESEGAKSSNTDAVTDQTTAKAKVGSQYVPPPPPPVKQTLKRSESDVFAMKSNKMVGGVPPVPQTIKRTYSLDSKSKSPLSRQFVVEVTVPSKTKPKPPTSTPPIIKASSDKPSVQADDIPPTRRLAKTATADDPQPPSHQVPAIIDQLPPGPPTTKTIMPQPPKNYNPSVTKSSHVNPKGPPVAPKGFTQSVPPPPDSYGQPPPMMPMPPSATAAMNSHPPRAPANGIFLPPTDSSHSRPPQPKISNQALKPIHPPLSAQLPPRVGLHNQIPLPPKSNSISSRGPYNQIPLPPRGDHPPPSGLQKPAITKANGHFPPPPKYNSQHPHPPPHKSIHQLTAPLPKGSSGGSYPSPYIRAASTDRTSSPPIDYVSHDFTHSDFDDYNSASSGGRDMSRLYPYRRNGMYSNDSWSDPKGVYCNEEGVNLPGREYRGEASYDPYYYPVEVVNYAEYDQSRREYADHHHHHHEGYSDDVRGHYYDDGRSNGDHLAVASRYYVSDADAGRRYPAEYDYDRILRGGDYSGDNHSSFTPTYRSRSPASINTNTMYSGGGGAVGSCYIPSSDFHASSNLSSTPGGGKGHHNNGVVKYDKNISSNSTIITGSNYIVMPPHRVKQTSPLVAPPPLPPRRSIELSPTSANALKTPR